jgi:hypothetical protein
MCCMFQSATSFDHENAPWYPWYDDVWYADSDLDSDSDSEI